MSEFPDKPGQFVELSYYSTDDNAAFGLVDYALSKSPNLFFDIWFLTDKREWVVGFTDNPTFGHTEAYAKTRPLAICRAFLKLELE
jgi:hypothetical protein